MNKNTGIIIGVIALIVIVGGVYASMNKKGDVMMKDKVEDVVIMQKEADTMMKDSEMKGEGMMKVGTYEAYDVSKVAQAETGDVVLFFHASWCPSCRGLNSSIESNLKLIPEGVTILKTDYDKETELKKKYGVTSQHTLVQVDKDGNLVKKWSGSPSLADLVSEIK